MYENNTNSSKYCYLVHILCMFVCMLWYQYTRSTYKHVHIHMVVDTYVVTTDTIPTETADTCRYSICKACCMCIPCAPLKSTDAHLFSPLQLLLATGDEWGSERGIGGVLETGAMREEVNCGGLTIQHYAGAGCIAENRTVRGGVTRLLGLKWCVRKGFLATAVVTT